MRPYALLLVLSLGGCAPIGQLERDLNVGLSEMMGSYSAPLMGGSPRPSGCQTRECLAFDDLERLGYESVRAKRITYMRMVDVLWEGRRRLWPNSNDGQPVYEYQAFLRVLAEQVDQGKVSPTQWEYLVESKLGEIRERQRGRVTRCNTVNAGTPQFPNYQTLCRN